MTEEIRNGASPIRAGDFLDPTAIPATISLPAAVWQRLTADLRGDDREGFGRPELPDTPLHVRIELFLEMQLIAWEGSIGGYEVSGGSIDLDSDLDDRLPF